MRRRQPIRDGIVHRPTVPAAAAGSYPLQLRATRAGAPHEDDTRRQSRESQPRCTTAGASKQGEVVSTMFHHPPLPLHVAASRAFGQAGCDAAIPPIERAPGSTRRWHVGGVVPSAPATPPLPSPCAALPSGEGAVRDGRGPWQSLTGDERPIYTQTSSFSR